MFDNRNAIHKMIQSSSRLPTPQGRNTLCVILEGRHNILVNVIVRKGQLTCCVSCQGTFATLLNVTYTGVRYVISTRAQLFEVGMVNWKAEIIQQQVLL